MSYDLHPITSNFRSLQAGSPLAEWRRRASIQKNRLTAFLLLALCLLGFSGCHFTGTSNWQQATGSQKIGEHGQNVTTASDKTACERVISLSPSVTELLYALHLGPQVVGVTRFCTYPKEALRKPKVGGYLDPDMEAILRLRPNWVMLRREQVTLSHNMEALGIHVLPVDHTTVDGIVQSVDRIGQVCHREPAARALHHQLDAEIQAVARQVKSTDTRPKVLVVVDRETHASGLRTVFVAGEDGFYSWMIDHAGGTNVLKGGQRGFFQISAESVLRMNPDVILEILPSVGNDPAQQAQALKPWQTLPRLSAVRNHRIDLLTQDYMVIPGPRFGQILLQFARAIHPELDWTHESSFPATASQ
jgi:iron complex transport system substrate-binding protein